MVAADTEEPETMTRITKTFALALLGLAALAPIAAHAQQAPARAGQVAIQVGSGEGAETIRLSPGMLVGGALVRSTGSGESASQEIIGMPAGQAPAFARVVGSGENLMVEFYSPRG